MAGSLIVIAPRRPDASSERGFGLIDAMVGLSILTFGLLGICAAFAQGMHSLSGSNLDIVAREKAVEAIESVSSSRDTRTIEWSKVRNVLGETGSDGGVFLDGAQPLKLAGPDGLINTADDLAEIETLVQPGPDGQLGNADDQKQPLTEFTRQIEIRTLNATLRQITVTIKYNVSRGHRDYVLVTYISSYS